MAVVVLSCYPLMRGNVTFDLDPLAAESQVEEPIFGDNKLQGRFLVVDDRRDIRFLAKHFITQFGGDVATAENGQECLDVVSNAIESGCPFDAILMDMQNASYEWLRCNHSYSNRGLDTPIIALTANAMDGDAEACLKAGCNAFLSKPIDRDQLFYTLYKVVQFSEKAARDSNAN